MTKTIICQSHWLMQLLHWMSPSPPLKNIINSFESNIIVSNFFTILLQIVEVANSYQFVFEPTTYITLLHKHKH